MFNPYPDLDPLAISRWLLRLFTKLNLLFGQLIFLLLTASLLWKGPVMEALGVKSAALADTKLILGMRLIMVLGICGVPVVDFIFTRLLMILDTVKTGNPFVTANAARIQSIAWALLVLEGLHLAVGAVAAGISYAGVRLQMGSNVSAGRWLAVALLFVLARVFQQGVAMREELEGTV